MGVNGRVTLGARIAKCEVTLGGRASSLAPSEGVEDEGCSGSEWEMSLGM